MMRPYGLRVPYVISFNSYHIPRPRHDKQPRMPCLNEFITLIQSIQSRRDVQECSENYSMFKKCIEKYL